ncbi:hypothetical protein ABCW43_00035 [Neorhizobium sp. IRAMC:178]|uniref:hypothetical protein n=1 Tax=Neorhizobium tunisiense TaxID=3144793 RepID=UPI0031F7074F
MSTVHYVNDDGVHQGGWDGSTPPPGLHAVPSAPDDARQIWDFDTETWSILEVPALDVPPVQIACVLHAITDGGDVTGFGGSFRIAAMWMPDVGTVIVIFTQHLGEAEPFAVSNNGVSISVAEWGGDFATIEIRDHAGGSLITPAHFGFSLYNL